MSGAFAGGRTTTPNLLGRELVTVEDVEAAYEAIAVAQLRRSQMLNGPAAGTGNSHTADVLVVHED